MSNIENKKLTCPSCGGNMEVDYKNRMLVCPYCDTKVILSEDDYRLLNPGGNQNDKKNRSRMLIAGIVILIAVIAIIVVAMVFTTSKNVSPDQQDTQKQDTETVSEPSYDWPTTGIAAKLPEPPSSNGKILADFNDMFSVEVYDVSTDDYRNYIESCEERGFNVDPNDSYGSYNSYDQEGYHLTMMHISESKTLMVTVEPPIKMSVIDWASIESAANLPKPKSEQGNLFADYNGTAMIYVGETSREDFNEYVNVCQKAGYTGQQMYSGDYFYAMHKEFDENLMITYLGDNMMLIQISKI